MTVIGDRAPMFALPDTEGATHEPDGALATVVVFTCNHCPYALAWHERIVAVARDYAGRAVRMLAVNPNDAERYPGDSPQAMRARVERGEFDGVPSTRCSTAATPTSPRPHRSAARSSGRPDARPPKQREVHATRARRAHRVSETSGALTEDGHTPA
ncbi:MAG: hypothetical protein ACHQDY_01820 [Solirubrobacterales bacterium]